MLCFLIYYVRYYYYLFLVYYVSKERNFCKEFFFFAPLYILCFSHLLGLSNQDYIIMSGKNFISYIKRYFFQKNKGISRSIDRQYRKFCFLFTA